MKGGGGEGGRGVKLVSQRLTESSEGGGRAELNHCSLLTPAGIHESERPKTAVHHRGKEEET